MPALPYPKETRRKKTLADGSVRTYKYRKHYAQGPRAFASITVALSEAEVETIAAAAAALDVSGSEFLRSNGLRAARKVKK